MKILKLFGYSIVPNGKIEGLEAANKQLQEAGVKLSTANKASRELLDKLVKNNDEFQEMAREAIEENTQLREQIANSKFIPSTKPNLDLAVDTIIGWGNNRTLATFIKRLLFKVDDSIIETASKYVKTEIKKRKLVDEKV